MGQAALTSGIIAWGSTEYGQTGAHVSQDNKMILPTFLDSLRSMNIISIACGGHHSLVLSSGGELYTWGYGKDGQLGHNSVRDVPKPRLVRGLQGKSVKSISCSSYHSGVCLEDGSVYMWGRNVHGQLGITSAGASVLAPTFLAYLEGTPICSVSCGGFHTLFLSQNDSSVYSCGLGKSGRLGHGNENDMNMPTEIIKLRNKNIKSICAGLHISGCITHTGKLYTWGGSAFGNLGLGPNISSTEPKRVLGVLENQEVTRISIGSYHTVCVTADGSTYSFGQGGRLGHSPQGESDEYFPRIISALSGLFVSDVSCGSSHTAVALETGDVWAWGTNRTLGHTHSHILANIPTCITSISHYGITRVACGESHTLAVCNNNIFAHYEESGKVALDMLEKSTIIGSSVKKGTDDPLKGSQYIPQKQNTLFSTFNKIFTNTLVESQPNLMEISSNSIENSVHTLPENFENEGKVCVEELSLDEILNKYLPKSTHINTFNEKQYYFEMFKRIAHISSKISYQNRRQKLLDSALKKTLNELDLQKVENENLIKQLSNLQNENRSFEGKTIDSDKD